VTHARGTLTVAGRLLLVERVLELGWTVTMAAEAQGCSAATGYKWLRRFRAEGHGGLQDRSSRPHRSPTRLSHAREQAILQRRGSTLEGPHQIAWALGEAPSTVHRVLRRLGAPRLADIDRPTRTVVRYERERPGELVHVDIKKQGRVPAGGGWRILGRAAAPSKHRGDGYDFIHAAVDDRSRLAYAEILPDERKETASAFMTRAIGFYADHGVSVEAGAHGQRVVLPLTRVRSRPRRCRHRPPSDPPLPPADQRQGRAVQPDAEVGVGYARPYETNASRTDELERWLHHYNYHRPHMAHAGRSPITVVNNVPRKHS
jgi:transposase